MLINHIIFPSQVYTFGCNDEGALGRLTPEEDDSTQPEKVALSAKIVQVSAGDSHSAALADDGRVFMWGTFRVSMNLRISLKESHCLLFYLLH